MTPDATPDSTVALEDCGPLRFERRRSERWPVATIAVASEAGGPGFGQRHQLIVEDESNGGLGARCNDAIIPGTVLTVAWSEPGGPVREGVVIRCLPCGNGYRLGIGFARAIAA